MSHYTKIEKANIVSPEAFKAAVKELGLGEVEEKSKIRGYAGSNLPVDYAVKIKDSNFDLGLVKAEGRKYDLIADWSYMQVPSRLHGQIGGTTGQHLANALVRLTAKHTIVAEYRRQGFMARVTEKEDKSLTITLSR